MSSEKPDLARAGTMQVTAKVFDNNLLIHSVLLLRLLRLFTSTDQLLWIVYICTGTPFDDHLCSKIALNPPYNYVLQVLSY